MSALRYTGSMHDTPLPNLDALWTDCLHGGPGARGGAVIPNHWSRGPKLGAFVQVLRECGYAATLVEVGFSAHMLAQSRPTLEQTQAWEARTKAQPRHPATAVVPVWSEHDRTTGMLDRFTLVRVGDHVWSPEAGWGTNTVMEHLVPEVAWHRLGWRPNPTVGWWKRAEGLTDRNVEKVPPQEFREQAPKRQAKIEHWRALAQTPGPQQTPGAPWPASPSPWWDAALAVWKDSHTEQVETGLPEYVAAFQFLAACQGVRLRARLNTTVVANPAGPGYLERHAVEFYVGRGKQERILERWAGDGPGLVHWVSHPRPTPLALMPSPKVGRRVAASARAWLEKNPDHAKALGAMRLEQTLPHSEPVASPRVRF